eukprot:10170717-Ditylum_brightwellii.AAC.1
MGNTCCEIFVTDKGFVFIVPLKSKEKVILEVKLFAKEVGASDEFICDAMRVFCTEIGTMLRVLEEGTLWANKAELYIGLIKEAAQKDKKNLTNPLLCVITVLSKECTSTILQLRIPLSSTAPPLIQPLQ